MAGVIAALSAFAAAMPALASASGSHLGGGGGALNVSLTRTIAALVLCLALAAAAALLLKRGGGRLDLGALRRAGMATATRRRITILETRRVSQHADVCLFSCDGRDYLVLSSASSQQLLHDAASLEADEA